MIALRLVYTLCSVFDTSTTTFSPLNGSLGAKVCLEVIPLMLAIIAFMVTGILTIREAGPPPTSQSTPIKMQQQRSSNYRV